MRGMYERCDMRHDSRICRANPNNYTDTKNM